MISWWLVQVLDTRADEAFVLLICHMVIATFLCWVIIGSSGDNGCTGNNSDDFLVLAVCQAGDRCFTCLHVLCSQQSYEPWVGTLIIPISHSQKPGLREVRGLLWSHG